MQFEEMRYFNQQKDEIDEINKKGIEKNRKGKFTISVVDKDNNKISGGKLTIKQNTHDFMFGANIFMLDCFETDKQNELYEDYWLKLFNTAVVPFYWGDLEPEKGKPRYAKDSKFIFRRPPVERCLEFCDKNNVIPKGHTLVWHKIIPEWASKDGEGMWQQIEERMTDISKRYKDKIKTWDVVNESLIDIQVREGFNMPSDYVFRSVHLAEKLFKGCSLFLNEDTPTAWHPQKINCAYSLLLENMRLRNARVDGIGMQYHLFFRQEELKNEAETYINPKSLIETMDMYSRFGVPLHISEITLPSYRLGNERALALQAELARELYTLWFAHSSVDAIIWWNLVTGGEYSTKFWDEGYFDGSLVNKDFTKKPAYEVLYDLINNKWKTNVVLDNDGENNLCGFYGKYTATYEKNGKTTTCDFHLKKGHFNNFVIEI